MPSATPSTLRPSVLTLARSIDHSLLHPTLTDALMHDGLVLARRCACATACVQPCSVPLAHEVLAGSDTGVCAVVGFPHGNSHPEIVAAEAARAIAEGATEIDMVAPAGKVLGGDWTWVAGAIRRVNDTCAAHGALLKVIFENDYLQDPHIARLCELCTEVGVAFVKTSTGYGFVRQPSGEFNYTGATDHHLRLMREHCGPRVQIKAAGGVRTLDNLLRVLALGATRVGATATEAILAEAMRRGYPEPVPPGLAAADPSEAPATPGC